MSRLIDLTGQRFTKLLVLHRAPNTPQGKACWVCQCDCGKVTVMRGVLLRRCHAVSCGCWKRERIRIISMTHGLARTPEYKIFHGMITRCTNARREDYADYGGRGICVEWETFEAFYHDMGPRPSPQHTVERIDNNGNYSKNNCCWATRLIQANNQRRTRRIPYQGQLYTLTELSDFLGIKRTTIKARFYRHGHI